MINSKDTPSVLVTGGAGFIGSHLVDKLLDCGYLVRVLDNLSNGSLSNLAHHADNPKLELQIGSVIDPFDVNRAVKDVDVVFHLACLGVRHSLKHPFENHKVNAEGSLLMLQTAWEHRVKRFVYCASSEIYGTAVAVPMTEEHPTHPCTVYGASKLAGEAYARAFFLTHGMDTVVVRPFNTFGPRSHYEGDAGELIPKFIVRALHDRPLLMFGDGSQTRDFTYVADTASAILHAAESPQTKGAAFNIGSQFEISVAKVGKKVLALVGGSSSMETTKSRPGDVLRLFADSTVFRATTGWQPSTEFDDGLQKTIDWFRSQDREVGLVDSEVAFNWE